MELLIIPFLLALVALVIPRKLMRIYALLGALTTVIVAVTHLVYYSPSAGFVNISSECLQNIVLPFGMTFGMGYDGIGLVMILLTNIITFIILLSNYDNEHIAGNKLFTSMVFFMQMALLGVFTALDGMLFYIFWELSLIPVFLLFLWFGEKERRKALMKFFIYTFIGSLAMLFSLILIKSDASSFALEDLMAVQLTTTSALWVFGGFFIAFAVKIPLFPFHTWQPETYTKSPMGGTMLLGALMLKMALFGMIRWMIPLAPEALHCMTDVVIVLGIIGVVYAALLAIKQNDIKTVFAYASISHVGLIAAGIMVLNVDALGGAMVQIVNHSFVAVGLFLCADIIDRRLGIRSLKDLGGIAKQAPRFAFWFGCIVFAGISVPLTSGFIGEFLLIRGVYLHNWIMGVVAGTTLILACVYSFRAFQLSMYGPSKNFNFPDLTWAEWTSFFLIMIVVVFLGIYPQFILQIIEPSLAHLVEIIKNK